MKKQKMSNHWQQLTYYPLRWIWFGGLHPDSNSILAKFYFYSNFCFFGFILVLAVIEISVSYNNVYDTIESVLTLFLYLHIISKYGLLYYNKSILSDLLEKRSKFWAVEDFDGDVRHECEKVLKTANAFIKFYLTYSCLVASNFLIQPLVSEQLPVLLYVPEGWYYFLVVGFCYLTLPIVASIWGVDTTFYSVSTPLVVQLKLLSHKFETLNVGDNLDKGKKDMKELVDHHNFLIWYCRKINEMSSGIFLVQFLVAIAIACTQLFIASQEEFGFMNKVKCLVYFVMQIMETGIYCFTAEAIAEASENVGLAAYKSNWYRIPVNSVKKDTALVIARSQKRVAFSGLGLVWINLETFTRIFKTALSFYTYLNTMVYND